MKIVQITACSNRDYVNVYGLDESSKVWRWNPVAASWEPYKIEPRRGGGAPRSRSGRNGDVHDWDDR